MDAKTFIHAAVADGHQDIPALEAQEMIDCYILQCETLAAALRKDFESKKQIPGCFSGRLLEKWKDVLAAGLRSQAKTVLYINDNQTLPNFRESLLAAKKAAGI